MVDRPGPGGWQHQPRWPKKTPTPPTGPGAGRWKDDGKPNAPHLSWAEVVARHLIPGVRRRQDARAEDAHLARAREDHDARLRQIRPQYGLTEQPLEGEHPGELQRRIRRAADAGVGRIRPDETPDEYNRRLADAVAASPRSTSDRPSMRHPGESRAARHTRQMRESAARGELSDDIAGLAGPDSTDEQNQRSVDGFLGHVPEGELLQYHAALLDQSASPTRERALDVLESHLGRRGVDVPFGRRETYTADRGDKRVYDDAVARGDHEMAYRASVRYHERQLGRSLTPAEDHNIRNAVGLVPGDDSQDSWATRIAGGMSTAPQLRAQEVRGSHRRGTLASDIAGYVRGRTRAQADADMDEMFQDISGDELQAMRAAVAASPESRTRTRALGLLDRRIQRGRR